jgi:hypothetical protein
VVELHDLEAEGAVKPHAHQQSMAPVGDGRLFGMLPADQDRDLASAVEDLDLVPGTGRRTG